MKPRRRVIQLIVAIWHGRFVPYNQIVKLQAAVKYEIGQVAECEDLLNQLPKDDPDYMINQACILFKVLCSNVERKIRGSIDNL